jgi:hypothetical protein
MVDPTTSTAIPRSAGALTRTAAVRRRDREPVDGHRDRDDSGSDAQLGEAPAERQVFRGTVPPRDVIEVRLVSARSTAR